MKRLAPLLVPLAAAALAACGAKGDARRADRQPPLVEAAAPVRHLFVDAIEAVGTARANEQVTLAAPVTERVERLAFDDGDYVRRGQVIAVLAQGPERAALSGATAAEREATSQLARVKSLSERGFAAKALLDQSTAAAQRARSEAEAARAQIGDRVIRAPFSGHVSLRTISEGAIVGSGTPIAVISDISRIKLDFTVPETLLSELRVGQPIRAVAAAYPGEAFSGTVSVIDPVIDPATRALTVRALLPNGGNRLKPGMLMTVRIEAATREGMAVPELAVVGEGDVRFVFVLEDGKAKRVPVKTGLRDGGLIEVSGVPANARVIGEGVIKVTDGARVRTGPAAARTGAVG